MTDLRPQATCTKNGATENAGVEKAGVSRYGKPNKKISSKLSCTHLKRDTTVHSTRSALHQRYLQV